MGWGEAAGTPGSHVPAIPCPDARAAERGRAASARRALLQSPWKCACARMSCGLEFTCVHV